MSVDWRLEQPNTRKEATMFASQVVIVLTHSFVTPPKIVHNTQEALSPDDIKVISAWRSALGGYLLGDHEILFLAPYAPKCLDAGQKILRTCRRWWSEAFFGEPGVDDLIATFKKTSVPVFIALVPAKMFNGLCVELHRKTFGPGQKFAYTRAGLANGALCIFDQSRGKVLIKIG